MPAYIFDRKFPIGYKPDFKNLEGLYQHPTSQQNLHCPTIFPLLVIYATYMPDDHVEILMFASDWLSSSFAEYNCQPKVSEHNNCNSPRLSLFVNNNLMLPVAGLGTASTIILFLFFKILPRGGCFLQYQQFTRQSENINYSRLNTISTQAIVNISARVKLYPAQGLSLFYRKENPNHLQGLYPTHIAYFVIKSLYYFTISQRTCS